MNAKTVFRFACALLAAPVFFACVSAGTPAVSGDYAAAPAKAALEVFPQLRHTGLANSIAYSAGGDFLLSGAGAALVIRDVEKGGVLRMFPALDANVNFAAFSPDGKRLVSGAEDGSLRLWDTESGWELRAFRGHTASVEAAAFSPDGKFVVSGAADGTLKLWDLESGWEPRTFAGHGAGLRFAAFCPEGRRTVSGGVQRVFYNAGSRFGSEGSRLVSGAEDGTVIIWDVEFGRQLLSLSGKCLAFDERRIASGAEDGTISLWDAGNGRELRSFKGHDAGVIFVAFSREGGRLVSGAEDETIKIWDADSSGAAGGAGRPLAAFSGKCLALSPDGKSLAAARGSTVMIIDTESGRRLAVFSRREVPVLSAAFSPDGRHIASEYYDGKIEIWAADSGRLLRTY